MPTQKIKAGYIDANGSSNGQVLTSNGSFVYWANSTGGGGFTNGQSISVNNFVVTGAFTANSSNGTTGQVLTTNGSAVYWSTVAGGGSVNTDAQYVWTNNQLYNVGISLGNSTVNATMVAANSTYALSNTIIANSYYAVGRVGFANATASKAYSFYNANTDSIDTVFG